MRCNMQNGYFNDVTQQFTDLILKIVALPEDQVTEESVNEFIQKIHESFEQTREEAISTAVQEIKNNPVEKKESLEELRNLKAELLEDLNYLSEYKKMIISEIMDLLVELCEEAMERYEQNYNTIVHFELIRDTQIPTYAHNTDAGADVYAPEDFVVPAHSFGVKVPVGFKMAMASGWEMQVRPRSGMSMKTQLRIANTPGTIDADYRDEVAILFDNFSDEPYYIKAGDRIAQFVISPVHRFKGLVTESVANIGSNRGGGFGSSGN